MCHVSFWASLARLSFYDTEEVSQHNFKGCMIFHFLNELLLTGEYQSVLPQVSICKTVTCLKTETILRCNLNWILFANNYEALQSTECVHSFAF